jgi:hypothetical protein
MGDVNLGVPSYGMMLHVRTVKIEAFGIALLCIISQLQIG